MHEIAAAGGTTAVPRAMGIYPRRESGKGMRGAAAAADLATVSGEDAIEQLVAAGRMRGLARREGSNRAQKSQPAALLEANQRE